jgi:hypothetical protein
MTRLRYSLPTLHEHVAMPYARLTSGRWLTFAGWESNPLDSIEEFPLLTYPGLTWRDPNLPPAVVWLLLAVCGR